MVVFARSLSILSALGLPTRRMQLRALNVGALRLCSLERRAGLALVRHVDLASRSALADVLPLAAVDAGASSDADAVRRAVALPRALPTSARVAVPALAAAQCVDEAVVDACLREHAAQLAAVTAARASVDPLAMRRRVAAARETSALGAAESDSFVTLAHALDLDPDVPLDALATLHWALTHGW